MDNEFYPNLITDWIDMVCEGNFLTTLWTVKCFIIIIFAFKTEEVATVPISNRYSLVYYDFNSP